MKKIKKIGVIILTIIFTCGTLAGCDVEEMMMGGGNKVEIHYNSTWIENSVPDFEKEATGQTEGATIISEDTTYKIPKEDYDTILQKTYDKISKEHIKLMNLGEIPISKDAYVEDFDSDNSIFTLYRIPSKKDVIDNAKEKGIEMGVSIDLPENRYVVDYETVIYNIYNGRNQLINYHEKVWLKYNPDTKKISDIEYEYISHEIRNSTSR